MSSEQCPKCGATVDKQSSECGACGFMLNKLVDRSMWNGQQVMGNAVLVEAWKQLLQNYEDQTQHDRFVQQCMQYKKLDFASQQYRQMRELNPLDDTAQRMQAKIIQLVSFQMQSMRSSRELRKAPGWTKWAILITSSSMFFAAFTGKLWLLGLSLLAMVAAFALRLRRTT